MNKQGLKLSELRPCDNCGGKLIPQFHIVDIHFALFSAQNANSVLGLTTMWGGLTPQSLAVAEAMAPGAEEAVIFSTDLKTRLFICRHCYLGIDENGKQTKRIDLVILAEKRHREIDEAEEKAEAAAK